MKALIKYEEGTKKFSLKDVSIPEPGLDDALIKVHYAGICGTDLHIYHGTFPDEPPLVVGHEFSGEIVKLGKKNSQFSIGDKVIAETNQDYCGDCELCRAGRFCLCNERKAFGQKLDGVFAEYAVIKESNLHKLDDGISMKAAALAEPLSCIVHALMERSSILAEDVVLVCGPGSIGLLAALMAMEQGARVIISGTDSDQKRLALASELGIYCTVDVTKENLQSVVHDITGGRGVDVVLECSGVGAAVNDGLDALKKRGIFTQIGLTGGPVSMNPDAICFKEIDYRGCLSKTNWSWNRTNQLLSSQKLPLEKLISHILPLDDWEEAMKIAEQKQGVKVLFDCQL